MPRLVTAVAGSGARMHLANGVQIAAQRDKGKSGRDEVQDVDGVHAIGSSTALVSLL